MRPIDGDALEKAFYQKMKELLKSTDTPYVSNEALSLLCGASLITKAPTIEEERKTGKWIMNDNGTYSCSLCSSWIPEEQYDYARYCLYCGANMRGEKDETD